MTISAFVLHVFACHRIAQLITHDRVAGELFRWRLIRRAYIRTGDYDVEDWDDLAAKPSGWDGLVDADGEDAPGLAYLVRCWWCAGIYITAAWTALYWLWPHVWRFGSTMLAASTLLVVIANLVGLSARR